MKCCSLAKMRNSNTIPPPALPFLANLTRRSSRHRWRSSWPGPPTYRLGREAARTLALAGQRYREYTDVGVAGLWRLLERIGDIRSSPVVIVAAGMDAALVSVVGGLVSSAVIPLPTSVGYGVALGGATALHAALASCAPGISVVNIDNGYGAACADLRISLALAASQNAPEHLE
jgi:pyridinium-3,5-biscarboxylic acid mononucleotide synthase